MSLNTVALSPAFVSMKMQMDYSADLVEESKANIIKELETTPLIINKHNFLEGAAPFAIMIVLAEALDLKVPFDALCALKDEAKKVWSTFLERLWLHLESIALDKVVSIPLIKGSK